MTTFFRCIFYVLASLTLHGALLWPIVMVELDSLREPKSSTLKRFTSLFHVHLQSKAPVDAVVQHALGSAKRRPERFRDATQKEGIKKIKPNQQHSQNTTKSSDVHPDNIDDADDAMEQNTFSVTLRKLPVLITSDVKIPYPRKARHLRIEGILYG